MYVGLCVCMSICQGLAVINIQLSLKPHISPLSLSVNEQAHLIAFLMKETCEK